MKVNCSVQGRFCNKVIDTENVTYGKGWISINGVFTCERCFLDAQNITFNPANAPA